MKDQRLGYRSEACGKRDWRIYASSGRYVGTVTRMLLTDSFEYRTSQTLGRDRYTSYIEAERALIDADHDRQEG